MICLQQMNSKRPTLWAYKFCTGKHNFNSEVFVESQKTLKVGIYLGIYILISIDVVSWLKNSETIFQAQLML